MMRVLFFLLFFIPPSYPRRVRSNPIRLHRRIEERATAAAKLRAEHGLARQAAKEKEMDRLKEAEEHRKMLRARSDKYRTEKRLAETSAYSR